MALNFFFFNWIFFFFLRGDGSVCVFAQWSNVEAFCMCVCVCVWLECEAVLDARKLPWTRVNLSLARRQVGLPQRLWVQRPSLKKTAWKSLVDQLFVVCNRQHRKERGKKKKTHAATLLSLCLHLTQWVKSCCWRESLPEKRMTFKIVFISRKS